MRKVLCLFALIEFPCDSQPVVVSIVTFIVVPDAFAVSSAVFFFKFSFLLLISK